MSQANQLLSTNRCSKPHALTDALCLPAPVQSVSINFYLSLSLSAYSRAFFLLFSHVFVACCLWKMCDKSDPKKQKQMTSFSFPFLCSASRRRSHWENSIKAVPLQCTHNETAIPHSFLLSLLCFFCYLCRVCAGWVFVCLKWILIEFN